LLCAPHSVYHPGSLALRPRDGPLKIVDILVALSLLPSWQIAIEGDV